MPETTESPQPRRNAPRWGTPRVAESHKRMPTATIPEPPHSPIRTGKGTNQPNEPDTHTTKYPMESVARWNEAVDNMKSPTHANSSFHNLVFFVPSLPTNKPNTEKIFIASQDPLYAG